MNNTYIIAEIGNTHEGSVGLAKQFILEAANCGVDAVKFQTHIFEAESILDAPNPPYFSGESRKEYFERTAFTKEQWKEIKDYTEKECKKEFMSSPFSLEAVDLLESINLQTYKIPSGEVTNIPLLIKIAKTGKKVLLSSGMSNWKELDEAISTLKEHGCTDLCVLQCTSEYPCPPEESGLNVLEELKERYHVQVGYSDHTLGIAIPLAAICKGATVIEKHFTLSKKMYGSDAKNSTEPEEFVRLVQEIRNLDIALQSKVDKNEKAKTLTNMKEIFEKSIVANQFIKKGSKIKEADLAYKKPGTGIPALEYNKVIGKKVLVDLDKDRLIHWEDLLLDNIS